MVNWVDVTHRLKTALAVSLTVTPDTIRTVVIDHVVAEPCQTHLPAMHAQMVWPVNTTQAPVQTAVTAG